MRSVLVSVGLLSAIAFAAGCAKSGNCEAVVDKTIALVAAEAGSDEAQAAARDKMASERDDMVKKCLAEHLSKDAENCALAAKDLAQLAACDSK